MIEREQHHIDAYKAADRSTGYNLAPKAGSLLGFKHSVESIEKSRQANIGRKRSQEAIELHRQAITGRPVPTSRGDNISKALRGKTKSLENREKLRQVNLGKKHTPRIGDRRLGKFLITSPENTVITISYLRRFCEEQGLSYSAMVQVGQGKCKQHKGWKAERIKEGNLC